MLNLLALIISIALLDSLNPVTIAVHVYLLGTPKPKTRTLTFIAGIFLAYFAGGILLSLGLGSILQYFAEFSDSTWQLIQAATGLLLTGFGVYLWYAPGKEKDPEKPASISPAGTFWLGIGVTVSDLPTAVPYIAAIGRILQAEISLFEILSALAFYNFIYVLPLLTLFGVYLFMGERGAKILQRINLFINRWSSPVLAILCGAAGAILFIDYLAFALMGWSLF